MSDDELQRLIDAFLYLVEVGGESTETDEAELAHLLDRLALAMRHVVDDEPPEALPDVPERDLAVLRKVAASRFPRYGVYNRAAALTQDIGTAPVEVANAVHDIATIADHLHAAAWLWRNGCPEIGLWYAHQSYTREWGEPMRSLQHYLHVLATPKDDVADADEGS